MARDINAFKASPAAPADDFPSIFEAKLLNNKSLISAFISSFLTKSWKRK